MAKNQWNLATGEWQEFYKLWRNSSTRPAFPNKVPEILNLGLSSKGEPLLDYHPKGTVGSRILITKSYEDMFHRLLYLRQRDKGDSTGAVLTGQPGTGASR
jgi:hypothetical protein